MNAWAMLECCAQHQPEGIGPPRGSLLRECESTEAVPSTERNSYLPPSDVGLEGVHLLRVDEVIVWEP